MNVFIAVAAFGSWIGMTLLGHGTLSLSGLGNLKYFTILSNLFAGAVAIIWLIKAREGDGRKAPKSAGEDEGAEDGRKAPKSAGARVERLKFIAACAVGLTFVTVVVFLGPLYGYISMFSGFNLFLHLVVPVAAMAEIVFLADAEYTRRDNFLVVVPPLLYGAVYLANNVINGRGEWPDTNDWYSFLAWGYPVGIVIFVIICLVTWLIGFAMRKAGSRRRAAKN